jgi:putative two-component system response regulator
MTHHTSAQAAPPAAGERILVVEDDDRVRQLLRDLLAHQGYVCEGAADVREARLALQADSFALVLCDVNLPGESGMSLVRHLTAEEAGPAVVIVSALDDLEMARSALDLGAFGFVTKLPFKESEIVIAVANALRRRVLERENREHRQRLEGEVSKRTADLRAAVDELARSERALKAAEEETVRRLAAAVESRDRLTGLHVERMSSTCHVIATRSGVEPEKARLLRIASALHDVGKISLPDEILHNTGELTPGQRLRMQTHARTGFEMLADSRSELLRLAASVALTHHERYDGSGYPRGLRGEQIPEAGRIAALADVFDAVTHDRPYQEALPVEEALELMTRGRGSDFDPPFLDAFLESVDEIISVNADVERRHQALLPEGSSS